MVRESACRWKGYGRLMKFGLDEVSTLACPFMARRGHATSPEFLSTCRVARELGSAGVSERALSEIVQGEWKQALEAYMLGREILPRLPAGSNARIFRVEVAGPCDSISSWLRFLTRRVETSVACAASDLPANVQGLVDTPVSAFSMLQWMQLHPVFPGAELLDFGERVGARALALNAALFGKLRSGDYLTWMRAFRERRGRWPFDSRATWHNCLQRLRRSTTSPLEDAQEACLVLSAVIASTYGSRARAKPACIDADLCLTLCECRCVLLELQKECASDDPVRVFLLRRLPSTGKALQALRGQIVNHAMHRQDAAAGKDGLRARNLLHVWLGICPEPQKNYSFKFITDVAACCECEHCGGIKPYRRSLDPRSKFCSSDCNEAATQIAYCLPVLGRLWAFQEGCCLARCHLQPVGQGL